MKGHCTLEDLLSGNCLMSMCFMNWKWACGWALASLPVRCLFRTRYSISTTIFRCNLLSSHPPECTLTGQKSRELGLICITKLTSHPKNSDHTPSLPLLTLSKVIMFEVFCGANILDKDSHINLVTKFGLTRNCIYIFQSKMEEVQ